MADRFEKIASVKLLIKLCYSFQALSKYICLMPGGYFIYSSF